MLITHTSPATFNIEDDWHNYREITPWHHSPLRVAETEIKYIWGHPDELCSCHGHSKEFNPDNFDCALVWADAQFKHADSHSVQWHCPIEAPHNNLGVIGYLVIRWDFY